LINGNIATVDDNSSFVEALAIRGDRILATGTSEEMQALALDSTQVIDLNGRTVLPGLIDAHLHGIRNGYQCYLQAVRLEDTYSRAEALAMYSAKAEELGPGEWIFTAGGWNVNQLDVPGMFTLAELDEALPNNPVSIAGTGAPRQVNSAALAAMGVTEDTPDPEGGSFLRDEAGNLTGALQGGATTILINQGIDFPSHSIEQQKDCLRAFLRDANMRGLTAWDDSNGNDPYDPEGRSITMSRDNHAFQAINQLWFDGELTARVQLHMQTYSDANDETIRDTQRAMTRFGDDMLRVAGVGEEPYGRGSGAGADAADFDVEEFVERYGALTDYLAMNGFQFKHHSSTAFSNELYLRVWEATNEKYPITDLNWSMDHPEDPSEDSLARMVALNINLIPTDNRADNDGGPPMRRIYDSGVNMCLGSDAMNVAPWMPFINLWFVTSGHAMDPNVAGIAEDQLLTRDEALRSMTVKCGKIMDMPGEVGSLQPGWYADMIVLSDDYFSVPVDDIRHLTSVLTIVDGRVVFADAEFAGLDM
jgi:predicted amidohydrolase YtcJ